MDILIVEDDPHKSRRLSEFVHRHVSEARVQERRSYREGLRQIVDKPPDLVLLDMSMPTFDILPGDAGGRTRPYAGRDILEEMKRRRISARVVVVTQFETFGEGLEMKTLDQLRMELAREFPDLYVGAVYYHPAQSDWESNLLGMIGRAKTMEVSRD